ncbi:uncharacterized protein RCC_03673 [Ramularia collo-cygni]|uniref:Uncharacterized protein n=1 Tax=Ramularia collo-cygni TaxID=112498 RepID=A0A2D3UZK6_9PEZI|nr:uncharacterized protein RCC_03673 [Ramularia collo-cygni]CZT17837.1 uncharacterized protein RCC_03673 [Ramularia collo-cygni]
MKLVAQIIAIAIAIGLVAPMVAAAPEDYCTHQADPNEWCRERNSCPAGSGLDEHCTPDGDCKCF